MPGQTPKPVRARLSLGSRLAMQPREPAAPMPQAARPQGSIEETGRAPTRGQAPLRCAPPEARQQPAAPMPPARQRTRPAAFAPVRGLSSAGHRTTYPTIHPAHSSPPRSPRRPASPNRPPATTTWVPRASLAVAATSWTANAARRPGRTTHDRTKQTNWGEARPARPEQVHSTDNSLCAMRRRAGSPQKASRATIVGTISIWFGRDSKKGRHRCVMIAAHLSVPS